MAQKKRSSTQARPNGPPPRRSRGFEAAGVLVGSRIRQAGAARGFALTRLLTRWEEIAGTDIAGIAQPVDIRHGQGRGRKTESGSDDARLGATLTLLTSGANAPLVEMQKPQILEKVNACYGYRAISRIRITQTAATGFAEAQARFAGAPARPPAPQSAPDAAAQRDAPTLADGITDTGLRDALARLEQNIRARSG